MATEIARADPNKQYLIVPPGLVLVIPTDPSDDIAPVQVATEDSSPARENFIIVPPGLVIPIASAHGSEESAAAPSKVEDSDSGYS